MPRINTGDITCAGKVFHPSNAATSWPHARARHIAIQIIYAFKIHSSGLVKVLFVCSLYLPANAQPTRTQQEKRVVVISFLEVPDVMTSGNNRSLPTSTQVLLSYTRNKLGYWFVTRLIQISANFFLSTFPEKALGNESKNTKYFGSIILQ